MGLLGLLAALAACQKGSLASSSFRLLVTVSGQGSACPASEGDLPLVEGLPDVALLRVTYRDPATAEVLCDAIVDVAASSAGVLGVPGGPDRVDVLVEAYDRDDRLLASGGAFAVDLRRGGTTRIVLARSETFSCAPSHLLYGRAFHSATLLPDGEVLIMGGLVADPTDPDVHDLDGTVQVGDNTTAGLYATNSIEIVDPAGGTVSHYDLGEVTARAFHEAYLLPSPGDGGGYRILLLGGLRVAGDPAAAPVADMVRDAGEQLLPAPAPDAVGAPTEILTYLPEERRLSWGEVGGPDAPRIRGMPSLSHAPAAGDAVPQRPPLVAGGWITYPSSPSLSFEGIDEPTGTSLGDTPWFSVVAEQMRAGATLTWIAADRALLFGGNLGSPAGLEVAQAGIVLAGIKGRAPTSAQLVLEVGSAEPVPRAGHTATAIGATEVLLAGGFQVRGGLALNPAMTFAQRVSFAGSGQNPPATVFGVGGAVEPVAHHDAVSLAPGDVLLSGGASAAGASAQALRYRDGALTVLATSMVVPRYGHRLTRLADGTVLVSGGFDADLGSLPHTISDLELYNPRTASDDPRPPGQAAGPACSLVK